MADSISSDGSSDGRTTTPNTSRIDLESRLISWDPSQRGGRGSAADVAANRRKIRSQASRASATQRKATMASRVQRKSSQTSAPPTPGAGCQAALLDAERLHRVIRQSGSTAAIIAADAAAPRHVDFQQFVSVVDGLESQRNWLTRALRETTLAQQSIRGDMRDAFTISPALFQATLFIAGTFSNTCGLSYEHVKLGLGMTFMRGASLDAVRGAITAQQGEHWVSMAVALLAGWELRFGDRDSYNIHMTAYRQLFGAPLDLKENSITMMRDFAFESLREQLNNLVLSAPLRVSNPAQVWHIQPGFDVFSPVVAPEVKSLFAIIRDTATFDPRPPSSLQFIRNQGLKAMAWTPHHGETIEPSSTFEGQWDPLELNALLHVRAAILMVIALYSHITHTLHKGTTYLDIMGAADVHAHSCIHLRTDALMGTKYQDVAIWARVTLASISRDPSRDDLFRDWLTRAGLRSWEALYGVLERHLIQDAYLPQTREFFNDLF